jgi:AcrR family transcriptional regulator
MKAPNLPETRARNATATREAILKSASTAFSRAGYDGVGLREIGQGAGVSGILVNRYFGTKEALFTEVVERMLSARVYMRDAQGDIARHAAQQLVDRMRNTPDNTIDSGDSALLIVHSSSSPQAVAIIRAALDKYYDRPLAKALNVANAGERGDLFLAMISGFQMMQKVLGAPGITGADNAKLIARLTRIFEAILE